MKIKNIAQYEETDSELAKYTICDLQNRINEAIEYIYFAPWIIDKDKEILIEILKRR